jgi:hypothetical protein
MLAPAAKVRRKRFEVIVVHGSVCCHCPILPSSACQLESVRTNLSAYWAD